MGTGEAEMMWTGKAALMDTDQTALMGTDQTALMGSAVYMSLCGQSYCWYIVFVALYIYIGILLIAIWNP